MASSCDACGGQGVVFNVSSSFFCEGVNIGRYGQRLGKFCGLSHSLNSRKAPFLKNIIEWSRNTAVLAVGKVHLNPKRKLK